jgi:hypothetical protein
MIGAPTCASGWLRSAFIPTRNADVVEELAQELEERQARRCARAHSADEARALVSRSSPPILLDRDPRPSSTARIRAGRRRRPAPRAAGNPERLREDLKWATRAAREKPRSSPWPSWSLSVLGVGANTTIFSL